jgi:hypothetical protein
MSRDTHFVAAQLSISAPILGTFCAMDKPATPFRTRLTATEVALRYGHSARHWRPDGASPPLVRSPSAGDGSLSAGNVHVSVLSDGSGHSAESEIIYATQIRAGGRRRGFYLAVRTAFGHQPTDRHAFVPPAIRQDPREVEPRLRLHRDDRGQSRDSERLGPSAGKCAGS